MKNKKSFILAIAAMYFPFIAFTFHQMLKTYHSANFYLGLLGFACTLGAFVLTIFAFLPKTKKV